MKTDVTETTVPTTTETTAPEDNADTGKPTGGETKTVQMSQSDLDRLMADRAGQAKKNAIGDLLKTLGLDNVTELTAISESHKQAETKRKETEEANKTELDKKQEQLDASVALQATQAAAINKLLIEHAFMRLAPGKEIPAERFADFLVLMDTGTIAVTDGNVEDSEVQAAIDKTLEGRDYLKANATNGKSHGSPPRNPASPKLPTPKEQPVQRKRRSSM